MTQELDKFHEYCERTERACDALVLAYNPDFALSKNFRRNFYIPSVNSVEEAFGYSLRKLFGEKEGSYHWADAVKWATVRDLDKLDKRIREGTQEVISGDPDYQTIFEDYFSSLYERFEHTWIYMKGDFYRFADGKREEAFRKFQDFWNSGEKTRWNEIHRFMREYTYEDFAKKDN